MSYETGQLSTTTVYTRDQSWAVFSSLLPFPNVFTVYHSLELQMVGLIMKRRWAEPAIVISPGPCWSFEPKETRNKILVKCCSDQKCVDLKPEREVSSNPGSRQKFGAGLLLTVFVGSFAWRSASAQNESNSFEIANVSHFSQNFSQKTL